MTDIEKELLAAGAELLVYAKHLTKDKFRAEDLLQETNMKVLIQRDKYREDKCFEAWAKRIMLNSFINSTNREKRIEAVESCAVVCNNDVYIHSRSETLSDTGDIYSAVERLPEGNCRIIKLLIAGHKYDEIAMMLDLPLGTVKSRIFFSRSSLACWKASVLALSSGLSERYLSASSSYLYDGSIAQNCGQLSIRVSRIALIAPVRSAFIPERGTIWRRVFMR